MKRTILLILICSVLFCGCNNKNNKNAESKPIAAVSIIPFKYFADKIAGELWNIISIIPSGANHTSYEPTAKELKQIANADIYFETANIGFEDAWTRRFKSIAPECTFYNVSENIELTGGHYHGDEYHGADPHYWLSPKDAAIIAENITNAFIKSDPKNKEIYIENLNKLKVEIMETDIQLKALLEPLKGSMFLIYHPALTYFAKDYDLVQIAIEDHGKEPSASYMAKIIDIAKENDIKTIFYQTQYTGQSVHTIANEIGAKTICFDPMAYNWPENMLSIANSLISNK
ncbi:MAG: zinc ABC transporter substrate-binding protein [Bacteroidales bacterium]|jgi:zinc transport system substrate-binding protein|nr:zinc ABC transporter substrate-binding protein [Bacteroidales bacterium]